MKREYLYIFILSMCIVLIIWGTVGLIKIAYNERIQNQEISSSQNIYKNEILVQTSSNQKKVSPNSRFALKKYYDECDHFEYEEVELPKELVNLTESEVKNYYSDWDIEEFTDKKLVLCKEVNGYCNQHFLIRLDDDCVNIYRIGTLGGLMQYKKTDISKDYLPEKDIEDLEEGITVYGEGKLSSVLEDFE